MAGAVPELVEGWGKDLRSNSNNWCIRSSRAINGGRADLCSSEKSKIPLELLDTGALRLAPNTPYIKLAVNYQLFT